uniref:Uncharacterized protein n=1 Tax=Nicotiana tabacum TaxID=4097 RepID=A0A1S4ARH3_TOBAC|nr:PREDICTED: uncharacterized protein LOC107800645 [Nicotiana tabacum]
MDTEGTTASENKQKIAKGIGSQLKITSVNDRTCEASQEHAAVTPTMQISNQEPAKNVFEILSQSMEFFGEHADDSGLQLISMGNNQQSNAANKKKWADQVEEEEHDSAEMYLGTNKYAATLLPATPRSNEASEKVQKEQVSNSTSTASKRRGLSPNVVVFVHSGHQQKTNNSADSKEIQISSSNMAVATGISTSITATYNLTPTNIIHALVSHDMETLRGLDNQRKDQIALSNKYRHIDDFGMHMGQDFYEEGEGGALLDATFNIIAREGDLSPRHVRSGSNKYKKKAPDIQHSWDSKATQEVVIRKPPMRNAKQKGVVPTTSTRSKGQREIDNV